MYQSPETIKDTIDLVERHEYVLPAIQREFVWKPSQIQRLFDSLMQGYPFGTFLFWHVEAENSNEYRFYDFVRDYHEKDNPHCPQLPKQTGKVVAVLDGQQRLTALNIGLRGSMATKAPNKWWNNPDAFPQRFLYLDLLAPIEENEEGERYSFEFLTPEQAEEVDPEQHCWFKVPDIMHMESGPPMLEWLNAKLKQEQTNLAFKILHKLHDVIHVKPLVSYYKEKSQDLSTVLNIFIRMNSGGTELSYSDLLLSIAVAQWDKLDARQEIHKLVDEINAEGDRFRFSKDMVLKAGLMLTDIGDVGFKVENFNQENMAILEENWAKVSQALRLTVRLLASYGFNGQNLRAHSSILPIAYYLCQRELSEGYLTKNEYAVEREAIRVWLNKSVLKASGIWGSGLDTLLTALRETIKEHGQTSFPVAQLESVMAKRGKSLVFEEEEIQELLELRYGDYRTFSLLSLLFPFVDFRNHFHVDHIFPQAEFKKVSLRKKEVPEEKLEDFQALRDQLPNLQLLEGAINNEKRATLPAEWLQAAFPDPVTRQNYCEKHLLGTVPDSILDAPEFFKNRKQALKAKLIKLLGTRSTPSAAPTS